MVSFLPKLSYTKHDFDNDSGTLVWRSVGVGVGMGMGMGELHESVGGTIDYYERASCYFGRCCWDLL
jgi:hypothetical protein